MLEAGNQMELIRGFPYLGLIIAMHSSYICYPSIKNSDYQSNFTGLGREV